MKDMYRISKETIKLVQIALENHATSHYGKDDYNNQDVYDAQLALDKDMEHNDKLEVN